MLREIEILVDAAVVEPLADALLREGALSVSVEDEAADTEAEAPLYGEPGLTPAHLGWQNNRLVVLIDAATDAETIVAAAATGLVEPAPGVRSIRAVADADWVRLTQAQFPPTQIGSLWIVPSWHDAPDPHAVVIRLDPGVAFGTGTHPTTRLMLQWLDEHAPRGARVLDYGCGSGILAIAAAK